MYRLKVSFAYPLQAWSFRDVLGLLLLFIVIFILILIPSIWILPVYFVGHKWNFLGRDKLIESDWGLKSFWLISFGYLFASFVTFFVEPSSLYSIFSSSYSDIEMCLEEVGLSNIVFILTFALFGFATLYRTNLKVRLSSQWSLKKGVFLTIAIVLGFIIIVGIYINICVSIFNVSIDDLASISQLFLASREDVEGIIAFSGKGITFFLVCLLVPLYEEIMFRGAILGSCQRYTNFHIANFFQATLFATIHWNLFMFPIFLLFGITSGILRKKTGGLLIGIIFHILYNILVFFIILALLNKYGGDL
jgi:uncharacterized protein